VTIYRDILTALGIEKPRATVQRRGMRYFCGRINTESGLMLLDREARPATFIHEIAHLAGGVDHGPRFASAMAELLEPWCPDWRAVAEGQFIRFERGRVLPPRWHDRLPARTLQLLDFLLGRA